MRFGFSPSAAALTALVLACAADPEADPPANVGLHGGQTGGEAGLMCSAGVAVSPLAFDERSPLGYSAKDVLTSLGAVMSAALSYSDHSASELSLALSFAGSAGYAANCRANEIDVSVQLDSADGAFAEQVDAQLFATSAERAKLHFVLAVADMNGALPHLRALLPEPSELVFDIELDAAGAHGDIVDATSDGVEQQSLAIASF